MQRKWQSHLFYGLLIAGLSSSALLLWSIQTYRSMDQHHLERARHNAIDEAHRASLTIDRELRQITTLTNTIASALKTGQLAKETLADHLYQAINLQPHLSEIGFAFAPFAYDPKLRLYGMAHISKAHSIQTVELDALYDYSNRTDHKATWYHQPLETGPAWLKPTFDEQLRTMKAIYAVPFFVPGATAHPDQPQGVLYAAYSIKSLEQLLHTLDLGTAGYSYLLSPGGLYLSHPNADYVDGRTSLFDTTKNTQDQALINLSRTALQGQPTFGTFTDTLTNQLSWVSYKPIPSTGWSLGAVFIQEDILQEPVILRKTLIRICLLAVLTLLLFCAAGCRIHTARRPNLWAFSISAACLCVLGTSCILLYIVKQVPVYNSEDCFKVANESVLQTFRETHNRQTLNLRNELPIYVPTGIYVQSIAFVSANDVRLTGYIWQKYYKGIHDTVSRGVIMPESESADDSGTLVKAYVENDGNVERWGWKFTVTLRQEFDYFFYPFGQENVWIQLWHKDFMRNVILVPDLEAYKFTSPSVQPGLLQNLLLPGWQIDQSYFSYRCHSYQTDFGLGDYSGLTNFPELYFNILITKRITGPFVSKLFPITVVFGLLFVILKLTTQREPEVGLLGFNTLNVVTACAGFFLVVIVSHIDLREGLIAQGILYVESFYFLTYGAILIVALNSLMFIRTQNRFFHYRENFLPQVLFWPVSQAVLLVLTAWTFYELG